MHIVYDENGNPVAHGHDHDHAHGHEHHHAEGCSAESCESGCDGCAGDKTAALLDYMLKHNEHHAAELDQLAGKLDAEGRSAAAEQIRKAVDEFKKGNLYLGLALSTVKEA